MRKKHFYKQVIFCKLCDQMFQTEKDHSDHMTLEHLKSGEFNCEICGKDFENRKMRNYHKSSDRCVKSENTSTNASANASTYTSTNKTSN